MNVTIKDVAKHAGVSVGTVSKVINNRGNVSDNLRKKVQTAIKELNYYPNRIARSLKSSTTRTVAVLLADITNPFQMMLAKGIEEIMYERDYRLLISSTEEKPEIERKNLMMLYEQRVDGIILCTTGKVNDDIRFLLGQGLPIVLVDRPVFSIPTHIVADNNAVGMELLVKHLYELGHRRIGVVHGDLNNTVHGPIRYDAVLKAFDQFKLNLPDNLQEEGGFSFKGGYRATERFFSMDHPPTALLSANNNMTAGILKACRDNRIRIPQDVSVVSFGELEYSWNLITPSVTCVNQSPLEIGQKAATLTLRRITNEGDFEIMHLFLTPELLVRDSTAPVP